MIEKTFNKEDIQHLQQFLSARRNVEVMQGKNNAKTAPNDVDRKYHPRPNAVVGLCQLCY